MLKITLNRSWERPLPFNYLVSVLWPLTEIISVVFSNQNDSIILCFPQGLQQFSCSQHNLSYPKGQRPLEDPDSLMQHWTLNFWVSKVCLLLVFFGSMCLSFLSAPVKWVCLNPWRAIPMPIKGAGNVWLQGKPYQMLYLIPTPKWKS